MSIGKTIFAQLMDFLPMHEFRKCVQLYRGNYKVRIFSYLDQFLCMAFAQLSYRESLRDIEVCLRAVQMKLYHMGIRGKVSQIDISLYTILQILSVTALEKTPILQVFTEFSYKEQKGKDHEQLTLFDL